MRQGLCGFWKVGPMIVLVFFSGKNTEKSWNVFFPKASSMLGFSFSCLTAWGSDLGCADGCGRQMGAEIAWTAADGVGATEWLEMGGEKKPLVMSDLGCADGCGRQMGAEIAWTAADGVGATEWLEMGGEKKPLVMSDLGCADGCGRQMGAENCADGCGRRGCNGVAGNGWGEEAAGDERPWLRGRLRTANGCGELRGRLRTEWAQRSGWKWVGRRSRWWWATLAARTAADGKWVRRTARTAADGVGARGWLEMGGEKKPLVMSDLGCADGCGRQMGAENCADGCGRRGCNGVAGNGWGEEAAGDERPWLRGRLRTANGCGELRRRLRTVWVQRSGWKWVGRRSRWWWATLAARMAADSVGATEWLEMGGEKGKEGKGWERKGQKGKGRDRKGKEGKGWERKEKGRSRWWWATLTARKAADGKWVRRTARTAADGVGARGWLEMGWEKKPLVMSDVGCADGCGRQMGAENCVDGCERRGCNGVAGNGWGEQAAGDERPWLRGGLRTANGCGELRGRLRTAWVQGGGWKWVGRRSRWWWATLAARTAADGKWVRRTAWTAADGVGARGWLEMGGEKKPLVMSDLGCARLRTASGCGELRGRLRTAWVQGGGWKWVGRRSRWWWATLAADGVGARGWLEMGGEKKPLVMSDLGCAESCGRQMGAEDCADGCEQRGCKGVAGNGWREDDAGDERPWLRGRLRTANGCGELRGRLRTAWVQGGGSKWVGRRSRWWWATLAARTAADGKWVRRTARTAADGVGARGWLEMGGEKKHGDERPWLRGRLRTANGCGELRGRLRTAWRGCNGVAGNWWGEEAAGDERPWLRGRLRTANGCGELRGRLRTAWVQGRSWKWVRRRSRWWWASLAARTAADGKWVRRVVMRVLGCTDGGGRAMGAEKCADGCGQRGCKGVAGKGWGMVGTRSRWWWATLAARTATDGKWVGRMAWTAADGVGTREWLEMGGEKKTLVMSDLGCADGCGRETGAENCADGCGRRGCNGMAGNSWGEKKPLGMSKLNWLRRRLRTGNGCGEFHGRLRTAWV